MKPTTTQNRKLNFRTVPGHMSEQVSGVIMCFVGRVLGCNYRVLPQQPPAAVNVKSHNMHTITGFGLLSLGRL